MLDATGTGGYGTRNFFIPVKASDTKPTQILKGKGYVTISLKGAHYRAEGNLWQKIFGGNDRVVLSTQVNHVSGVTNTSGQSVEEVRKIEVGRPYYFGAGRFIALKLPTDGDGIELSVTMSAVKSDNLSGALNILNSGELKGTLQLAPPAISESLAIANIVKKLLSATDPQTTLKGVYAGRLSTAKSDDPLRDACLAAGTLILIYRESPNDTSLDELNIAQLTTDGDGLKYRGTAVVNTYAMFQISFDEFRGEDPLAGWSEMFLSAEQSLDELVTATSEAERQRIYAGAFAMWKQAAKLLINDKLYTRDESQKLAAAHLSVLKKKYTDLTTEPSPRVSVAESFEATDFSVEALDALPLELLAKIREDYVERYARGNVSVFAGQL